MYPVNSVPLNSIYLCPLITLLTHSLAKSCVLISLSAFLFVCVQQLQLSSSINSICSHLPKDGKHIYNSCSSSFAAPYCTLSFVAMPIIVHKCSFPPLSIYNALSLLKIRLPFLSVVFVLIRRVSLFIS